MRNLGRSLCAVLLVAGLAAPLMPAQAQAPSRARLQLRAARTDVVLTRPEGRKVFLDLGVYIAALDAPFEIRVRRASYTSPIEASEVTQGPAGEELVALPAAAIDGWAGLKDFLEINVANAEGATVRDVALDFCPNSFEHQRVNDSGPMRPTYPFTCYGNPFALGMVWGIDEGWSVDANTFDFREMSMRIPDGRYRVTVSIAPEFQDLFSVDPGAGSVSLNVRVKSVADHCVDCPKPPLHQPSQRPNRVAIPTVEDPDPALLPDLVALPAWGMFVHNGRTRSRLSFGATVWTAGADSLVVEGYRRPNEETMDAFQYFHSDGQPVGRASVGSFGFDPLPGHQHWHFLQFARYRLLSADQTEVLRSKKEAFCLAPTDAIDLLLPGADFQPGMFGEGTSCGGPDALWIREILPLGWGDTYFQSVPGQSFNITKLPNGTYYVAVTANPDNLLYEQTAANNTEVRQIILKGRPGHRKVVVPPWNGIDTEDGIGSPER